MTPRPLSSLVRKELRQHGGLLVATWIVSLLAAAISGFREATMARSLTPLSATAGYSQIWLPLVALVLGNRLVVVEYYSRTQLFLETLPLSRLQTVWTKFGLGLLFLLSLGAASLGSSLWLAADVEPIDAPFALRLGVRVAVFIFATWGLCFAMGFIGRWRWFAWGMVVVGSGLIAARYQWDPSRAAPLALVSNEEFGVVRGPIPAAPLGWSLAMGGGGLLLATVLATIREGSLSEALAKRLTHRDFSAMAMIAAGTMMAASLLPERPSPSDYALAPDVALENASLRVEIGYQHPRYRSSALRLLRLIEGELRDLFELVGSQPAVPIRVVLDGSLDPLCDETDMVSQANGVLWRSNFAAPQWDPVEATASLLHGVILLQTRGRAGFDDRHWLLDGLAMYLAVEHAGAWEPAENAPPREGPLPGPALLARAKRLVSARPVDASDIDDWAWLSERESDAGTRALGYALVRYMAQRFGEAAVQRLARATLAEAAPTDVRAVVSERLHPMAERFRAVTGQRWDAFVDEWRQWLSGEGGIRDLWTFHERARLGVERREGAQVVVYEFDLDGDLPPDTLCRIAYIELSPFDVPLAGRLRRTEHLCTEVDGAPQVLKGALVEGGRVFAALEVEHHPTRYFSRAAARRLESLP